MKMLLPSLLVLASVLSAGCEQGDGFVHGERLLVTDCGERELWEPFDMPLEFLGVVRSTDVVMMRVSATSQWADMTDSLLIHLASYEQVRADLEDDGVAMVQVADGDVTIGLSLAARCPGSTMSLQARNGAVSFTRLGTVSGDQITATLTFDLEEGRSGEIVGSDFEAAIDFQVEAGTPFELFSDVGRTHGE